MEILKIVLTILLVIDCIALTVVVLMQEGKTQGLGALGGNVVGDTYWSQNKGRSREGVLVTVTKIMVLAFFLLAMALNLSVFAS
jgi:preprotein translocase subunit SecG